MLQFPFSWWNFLEFCTYWEFVINIYNHYFNTKVENKNLSLLYFNNCLFIDLNIKLLYNKHYEIEDFWWLHCTLSDATDIINSIYSYPLLLWISNLWLNTLSRIYAINRSHDYSLNINLREGLLLTSCVINLLIITISCHSTAFEVTDEILSIFITRITHKY